MKLAFHILLESKAKPDITRVSDHDDSSLYSWQVGFLTEYISNPEALWLFMSIFDEIPKWVSRHGVGNKGGQVGVPNH